MTTSNLKDLLLIAISNCDKDFRTTESLVREFGQSREAIMAELHKLWHTGKIRHPVGWERNIYRADRDESQWWRYIARGYTRREKWRMTMALISFDFLSDGTPGGRY